MSLISYLKRENPATEVSNRRRRPLKRGATKGKAKSGLANSRKRSGSTDTEFKGLAKAVKIESKANIGRKVATALPEIIEISDDSEDEILPRQPSAKPHGMMLRLVQKSQPQHHDPTPCKPPGTIASDVSWSFTNEEHTPDKVDSTSVFAKDHVNNDLNEEPKSVIERLRNTQEELKAAKLTIRKLRQETEKQDADHRLDRSKADTEANKDQMRLIQELETQRLETQKVAAERDRLRKQCEGQQNTIAKNTSLEAELLSLQERHIQETQLHQKQQKNYEDMLNDILKSKESATHDTQPDEFNERVHALQAEKTNSRPQATSSPAPSQASASTDEDKREDNVRKMFVRTKRQYDVLLSVANNLATCTRSMDLTSFGEFGRHLKRLRTTLETDTGVHGAISPALVLRKQDDDDESGLERLTQ